ncbi:MAG: GumC family protein [Phycisphaerae bacterium]|jgi:succinoglycan biosynthesis transport protein ExoP
MSQQLPTQALQVAPPPPPGDFGGVHQQTNIIKLLHNLFRGRYLLTGALAAVGLLLGVALGWISQRPVYQSTATIRIQPLMPSAMRVSFDVMPMFDSFVGTQVNFLMQPRTIKQAMTAPEWRQLNRGTDPSAEEEFRGALNVRRGGRDQSEIILVTFSDEDASAAFAGLTQTCRAYERIFGEGQGRELNDKRSSLIRDEIARYERNITDAQNRIKALAEDLGTDEPRQLVTLATNKRVDLQTQIYDLETRLRAMGVRVTGDPEPKAGEETPEPTRDRKDWSNEEIARVDPIMDELLARFNNARQNYQAGINNGLAPAHIQMRRIENEISNLREQMDGRKQSWLGGEAPAESLGLPGGDIDTPDSIKRRLEDLNRQLEEENRKSGQLAGKTQEMENFRQALVSNTEQRNELQKALRDIELNSRILGEAGLITVLYPDAPPPNPSNDTRLKFAGVFGFLGMFIPICAIGIYGMTDRRYRYSDEAIDEGPANTTLLGILPRLPSDLSDAEQAAAAAHCVHQIRTLIQIGGKDRRVLAVTSSNPGDGKTSMTLALGLSFASSGSKTLLVDLDLIGQGLSRGLRLRETSSLFNVLLDGDIKGRIKHTHMDRLHLLPSGTDDDHSTANRLAEPQINRLLDTVVDDYDVVLIDTGPVLGSIEAHLVCAQADGVVLVVGAGRARGQVKNAVDQLRRVNAKLLGLVFNLAQPRDFKTSAASQSFRSIRPDAAPPQPPSPTEFPELEPLPRVVAIDTKR